MVEDQLLLEFLPKAEVRAPQDLAQLLPSQHDPFVPAHVPRGLKMLKEMRPVSDKLFFSLSIALIQIVSYFISNLKIIRMEQVPPRKPS